MRAHVLQHVPFEGLSRLEAVLRAHEATTTWTALWRGDPLPSTDDVDLVIVLGGPMGVHDERAHPWLVDEKRFLERAIGREARVLGICLGAQLLAQVLGARVTRNRWTEIGWFPVERTDNAEACRLGRPFPERFDAFHWHGDTFDVPRGAVHLARSEACEHQAFGYEDHVLALQFHVESTKASVDALLEHCADELRPDRFVQSAEEMHAAPERFDRIHHTLTLLMEPLLRTR